MALTIHKRYTNINHTARKRTKNDIGFIVVHYVGALSDSKANADYYASQYAGASADFYVGYTGEIWQGNDYYNFYSWHCGGGLQGQNGHTYYGICKNMNSVGIEMCVRKRSTRTMYATDLDWYFEQATVDATVELVKHLMAELDIPVDHVIRHYDVTGKICPNPYVYDEQAWAAFKARLTEAKVKKNSANAEVNAENAAAKTAASAETKTSYTVQCGAFTKKANAEKLAEQIRSYGSQDKIWMDWVKRESGSAGFRQVNGDRGRAYGKYQFDYRHALVPFLQYCIAANADHYGRLKTWAALSPGSAKLVGNQDLAKAWTACCDAYPVEFEALQDRFAYDQYYLPVKKILRESLGIDPDSRDPVVKGTLFSMSIRSGSDIAAMKVGRCTAKTSDADLLKAAYESYGAEDAYRWTMLGQYGDALEAVKQGRYSLISTGNSEGFEAIVKKSGKNYLVQAGAFSVKANAEKLVSRLKAAGFDAIIK